MLGAMVLLPAGVCWMAFYQVTSSTEHESDDHRPVIVAAMKGTDPGINLQAMLERRPSRRTSCEASQVKMLLGRAENFGAEGPRYSSTLPNPLLTSFSRLPIGKTQKILFMTVTCPE